MPLPLQQEIAQQAPPKIDAHDLRNYLDRFQRDNADSRDVEYRWLAAYSEYLKTMAFHVDNNNHDTIAPEVTEFRLAEIRAARASIQAQDQKLEQEARELTVGKPA